MGEVLLDALIDSLKMLPILLVVYFLIELLEYKQVLKFEKSSLINGKASPIFGALFGSVPQCGFSVISTDLFNKRKLSVGALIAVYIATSDEALPLMLSKPQFALDLLILMAIKIVFAVLVGYLSMWLYGKFFKPETAPAPAIEQAPEAHLHGCCGHEVDNKFEWMHPILHALKIFVFVLVANVVFGAIIYYVGLNNITNFLQKGGVFEPLFACLIGLIPNCASSVVLTQLYMVGGLSFGSLVCGLSVNAGLGLMVLFKSNKNRKQNLFIVLMLVVPSLLLGYLLKLLL